MSHPSPPEHHFVIGGTRAGKAWFMAELIERYEHPHGLVQGEVISSKPVAAGEIEAAVNDDAT